MKKYDNRILEKRVGYNHPASSKILVVSLNSNQTHFKDL